MTRNEYDIAMARLKANYDSAKRLRDEAEVEANKHQRAMFKAGKARDELREAYVLALGHVDNGED